MNCARCLSLVVLSVGLGCASSPEVPFTEGDASPDPIDAVETFDVQPLPIDRAPPPTDRGVTVVDVPQDRGAIDATRETGAIPMCPASCATTNDCEPCWGDSERVGQYCCSSGLCIYVSAGMTCSMAPPDPGMPDAGDGGFSADLGTGGDAGKGSCTSDSDCPMGECCSSFFASCFEEELGLCD